MLLTGLAKGTDLGQSGVDGVHIVEPRPHLADVLNDEVRRIILLKLGLVFKRIMQLGERHATALEPAVEHLIDAGKRFAVNFKSNVIHPRAVVIIQLHAAELLQLRIRANHFDRAAVTLPHRHGCRPKAIAAQVPVGRLLNIFGKTTMFQMSREPINMLVLLQHQRLLPLDIKEPRRNRPVHDALFATRVERVFVTNVLNFPHRTLFFQVFGDELVIVPYLQAFVIGIGVVAIVVNYMERRDAIGFTKFKVILTIGRRDMHNTRTRLVRHEIRRVDGVNLVILWPGRARIKRLVFFTHQFTTGEFAQHVVIQWLMLFVLQGALEGFFGKDEFFA